MYRFAPKKCGVTLNKGRGMKKLIGGLFFILALASCAHHEAVDTDANGRFKELFTKEKEFKSSHQDITNYR